MCFSNIEFKDVVTPIILVATIFSSHWLASKQARKTKRAKWIEDFRFEVAKFFSLASEYEKSNLKTLLNFSASSWTIIMLLDDRNNQHQLLMDEIGKFGLFMTEKFSGQHMKEYTDRVVVIKNLSKSIITTEEKRI